MELRHCALDGDEYPRHSILPQSPGVGDNAVAVLNIVHPQVEFWGLGRTALQCWKRQVKLVAYMPYCAGESNGNYPPLAVDLYDSTQVLGKLAL